MIHVIAITSASADAAIKEFALDFLNVYKNANVIQIASRKMHHVAHLDTVVLNNYVMVRKPKEIIVILTTSA